MVKRWSAKARTFLGAGVACVVVATVLTALTAQAADGTAATDASSTDAALREVASSPRKDAAAEMIARSRVATDRAGKLRAAGDEAHARLADGLAKTWAEAARDLVRAIAVEDRAQAARRAATDAGTVADRERALLEEGIAQSGRVRAQLEALERDSKEPARTSAAANDPDAGPSKPRAPTRDARDGGAK